MLDIDRRSDIYSAGTILYELLTARPVVLPGSPQETLRQTVNGSPPRLRSLKPALLEELDRAVTKAIAKSPHARHRSAGDFHAQLLGCWKALPDRAT
jgi:serine/threonine-protein kinase